ncbi:aminoglycoside phosphotransferase [Streptomyces sp. NPDC007808]|uniref:aminoglycoside phosphotransferase n=1 Tax=Streptomyces sp. NPDC007808 TaxID=3364779 RepID=UPI003695A252
MPTTRLTKLPPEARAAIEQHTGPVFKDEMVSSGLNSEIAARVHTQSGTFFVKGLTTGHRRVWTQAREEAINPYIRHLGPAILWHPHTPEWDLIVFEDIPGSHADYSPGSPDLEHITAALTNLAHTPCPPVPLKPMTERMADYTGGGDLSLFAGEHLLHTDWNPHNALITDRAHLVDWAWAARGAAWIDPALWVIWLIRSGHPAPQAEQWGAKTRAWRDAPPHALDLFASAQRRLWNKIAGTGPDPWTRAMQQAAMAWDHHRRSV